MFFKETKSCLGPDCGSRRALGGGVGVNVWDLQRCVRPGWSPPTSEQVQVSVCSFPNSRLETDTDSGHSQNAACDWSWCCAADRQGREREDFPRFSLVPFSFHMGQ